MRRSWVEPVWAATVMALLIACAPAEPATVQPAANLDQPTAENVAGQVDDALAVPTGVGEIRDMEGTVLSNDLGCRVDGYCVLSVRAATGEVSRVIYGTPRGVPCVNAIDLAAAQALEPGHRAHVRGLVTEGGELDACASAEGLVEPAP